MGNRVGGVVGGKVGFDDGLKLLDGTELGSRDGYVEPEGDELSFSVGDDVGGGVGVELGLAVGGCVGKCVGADVGIWVGELDGPKVGLDVGGIDPVGD